MKRNGNATWYCSVLLALVGCMALIQPAYSQNATGSSDSDSKEYLKVITVFFEFLKMGKIKEGIDVLAQDGLVNGTDVSTQTKATLRLAIMDVPEEMGRVESFEVLKETRIGQHVVHVVTLAYCTNSALRFDFLFYRPADRWAFLNVNFTNDTSSLIRGLAKQQEAEAKAKIK